MDQYIIKEKRIKLINGSERKKGIDGSIDQNEKYE